ncbi:AMP-binding protein [Rhodococcus sp. BP-252]|nr:AMP-binding protein [Rhodococcus sp. BP-320]MBY6418927.1 AMP-binding protein [Rhodococcus sp. BP-321]MBY6423680.1 AMP-binding protein [Rhodococcus sp. BP-324]MBY6429014.1 AMP-binding protein [Rhodococcus sp. BP-323]MBY6434019.1 AMP-binding protein [Rhodococcus sp. BP-322]MBY6442900.1 AMP-binding protein [Rhodococcus sp. BP-319]MBY6447751.1 AMP-binding protein [Rhodococcus sp. BP-318]MBY6452618.1 AMP-binding protein [Rhodococcus sp. BP-315]MBY6457256.1 AMP-binding protein [Rhodococcus sp.
MRWTNVKQIDAPWTALYPDAVRAGMDLEFSTMRDAWDAHVATRPGAPAVHYFGSTLSFAEIDAAADALASGLTSHGLVPGDRVAIYLQNDPQWLVALLAAWKAGAVPVAINPMLREKELTHHLLDSGARALVCLDSLYDDVVAPMRDTTDLAIVVTTHPLDMTPTAEVPASIASHIGERRTFEDTVDWHTLLAEHAGSQPVSAPCSASDIGVLTYTSGTTGRSKGAMNLQSALVHNSTVYTSWWDLRADQDVIIGVAPVFHITGLVAGFGIHILSGAPIVLLHRFDAEETLRAIDTWRGTFMIGASTAFIALCNHPSREKYDLTSLTKTPSGGAPVGPALLERVRAATGWVLRGAYGMTETTSPTHLGPVDIDPPVDPDSGALSVGVPVPNARVRIVDITDGHDVAPGETGEIIVSGPMVVPGYWQLPEESAHAIRDGWLHTGDIGKMTEDGWLFVVDRLKDMINAGGYKVFPRDVEDVLYQHPAVREASVIGVPDEYRGETVKAFVSLTRDATVTPAELVDFCKTRMAAYKYPRDVVILDELPKTTSGKLLRRELRTADAGRQ